MRQILRDWCDYCENKTDFDKSHFYTLFWDDSEKEKLIPNDLEIIFSYFDQRDELIKIMRDYLFTKESNDKLMENKEIHLLIKEDIGEKIKLSKRLNFITSYEVSLCNIEEVEKSRNEEEFLRFYDEISDIVLDNWKIENKKTNALYEALYGLTNDYEMVWYLFSPLLKLDVIFSNYYELKKNNVVYSIYGKKIIYNISP